MERVKQLLDDEPHVLRERATMSANIDILNHSREDAVEKTRQAALPESVGTHGEKVDEKRC